MAEPNNEYACEGFEITGEQKRIVDRYWPTWKRALEEGTDVVELEEISMGFGEDWVAEPDLQHWCCVAIPYIEGLASEMGYEITFRFDESRGGFIGGQAVKNDP